MRGIFLSACLLGICSGQEFRLGDDEISALKYGDQDAARLYLGDDLVWEPAVASAPVEFFDDDFSTDPSARWSTNTGSYSWNSGAGTITSSGNGSFVYTPLTFTSQQQWIIAEISSVDNVNNLFAGPLLRAEDNATTPRLTVRLERDDLLRFRGLSQGNSGTAGDSFTNTNQLGLPLVFGFCVEGSGLGDGNTIAHVFDFGSSFPAIDASTPADQIFSVMSLAAGGGPDDVLFLDGSQSEASGALAGLYNGGSATITYARVMGGTWTSAPPVPERFAFTEVQVINSGGTRGSTVGDFDNDGVDEFVVGQNPVILDWNDATQSFDTFPVLANLTGKLDRFAGDGEAYDYNRDGFLDIIQTDTSNSGDTGRLLVYVNPGTLGGSWSEVVIDTWSGVGADENKIRHSEEAIGDVNGDGFDDVVVRGIRWGTYVFVSDGASSFAPRVFLAHNSREGLALGDLNQDGRDDIVLNGIWFASETNGTFTEHAMIGMEDWYPAGSTGNDLQNYAAKVRVFDFDGQNGPDVVICNSEELASATSTKPDGVRIYFNPGAPITGDWSAGSVVLDADHLSWHNLQIADMDEDGNMDVVAGRSAVGVDANQGELHIWPGFGNGSFDVPYQVTNEIGYQMALGKVVPGRKPSILYPETFNNGPVLIFNPTP